MQLPCVRVTFVLLVGWGWFSARAEESPLPPPPEAVDLTEKTHEGLSVSLHIVPRQEQFNEIDVLVDFATTGGEFRVRNTAMSTAMAWPGELVVRDSRGQEVNRISDLNLGMMGPRIRPRYDHLAPGKPISTAVQIQAARVGRFPFEERWIGFGEFTLQFEMYPDAIGIRSDRSVPIVRSPAVPFELRAKQNR